MTANNSKTGGGNGRKPLKLIGVAVGVVIIGVVVVWLKVGRGSEDPIAQLATFTAKRGPLTISVLEAGTIKAREQEVIYNEVEGRTSIVKIVPEGTRVKQGDLLVKLDVSTLTDKRIDQEIGVQNAQASFINAKENMEIVKNQAISDVNVAELTLRFAKQDLKKYNDPNGEYHNLLEEAKNKITLAKEELERARQTLEWSERLFTEKYISLTEAQADRLTKNRADVNVQVAENDLTLLKQYTYIRQIAQLESDVRQAEMALERTTRKANANVVQAEAELKAKEQEYNRQKDKLAKIEDQLKKATIYAPRDGMVIYATSAQQGGFHRDNRQPLEEGVEVFERQELIYLPTAASSKAEVNIHEASLEKVRMGLPAVITVDALPGKKFFGTLARIAPLPDAQSMWMNPDLKVYNSDVYLETDDPSLRTGMGCKVEIIVEQHEEAIYVPVQVVIRVKGKPTLYVVRGDGTTEERQVEIGLDNNSVVRVISGLKEGELVLMTPPLKEATVDAGKTLTGSGDSNEAADASRRRIRDRLDAANGSAQDGPAMGSDGQGQSAQERQGRRPVDANSPQGSMGPGPMGQNLTPEQREQMRKMMQNMTPEQRQQMEAMRKQFESMSPEEKAKMQQQFQQGAGGRQGRGQRQGAGRQGADQRQGGGPGQGGDQATGGEPRSRRSEGNP